MSAATVATIVASSSREIAVSIRRSAGLGATANSMPTITRVFRGVGSGVAVADGVGIGVALRSAVGEAILAGVPGGLGVSSSLVGPGPQADAMMMANPSATVLTTRA